MDHQVADVVIPEARSRRYLFRGQFLHLAALTLLGIVAEALAAPAIGDASAARFWFRLGIGLTVLHQVVVWLAFRAQLGWDLLTRWWGEGALRTWMLIFVPLLVARPVWRHFGLERAVGGDHFDLAYRGLPLVREGAFAWSGNAMYTFGFLALWAIALLTRSHGALVLALFQHAAVWAHFHGTEKPDLELIHGER